ncbi:ferredoxin [Methanoplanus sp. FWC-SCC4]|uniref:Ferredoxin n=1 Tax=Methanochimaera problematica TaxID=2609417 RepID=A0AA97I409_9EURY|nr:4Fe-4S binding protein [Methanoplanus sp. FWC-SCC4]WOF15826.1 ferredoxin [Methanoplanus sp. FWC-SCC4]
MIKVRREVCCYCGACISVCPEGALELIDAYLSVENETCKMCNICVRVCPLGALEASDEE